MAKRKSKPRRRLVLSSNVLLEITTPDEFLIFKAGVNDVEKGDDRIGALVDDEAASLILDNFQKIGRDLVIDYEHATHGGEYASPSGKAPAAGWIKKLDWRPGDGLYATNVRWTKDGGEHITNSEYRYYSPTFVIDSGSGRVVEILSIALTNFPAMLDIRPIAAKDGQANDEDDNMIPKAIADALGLGEDASEEQALAVIDELKKKASSGTTEEAAAKLIAAKAGRADIISAAGLVDAIKKGASADEAMTRLTDATNRITELEGKMRAQNLAAFVDRGMQAGKILASNRDTWEWMYTQDSARAEAELAKAQPTIPAPGQKTNQVTDKSTTRAEIIAAARRGWDDGPMLRKITKQDTYVNNKLRDAGLAVLTANGE